MQPKYTQLNNIVTFFAHNLPKLQLDCKWQTIILCLQVIFFCIFSHISSQALQWHRSALCLSASVNNIKNLRIIDVYIREAAEREIAKSKHIWKHLLVILSSHVAQKIALLKKSKHAAHSANPPNNELYLSFAQKQQMQVWCEGV